MADLPRYVAPPAAHSGQIYTTPPVMDGGRRGAGPARPRVRHASSLVRVHPPARVLHAAFRPCFATTPWRCAIPSPPSSWAEDVHLQAVPHARHTRPGMSRALQRVGSMPGLGRLCSVLVEMPYVILEGNSPRSIQVRNLVNARRRSWKGRMCVAPR